GGCTSCFCSCRIGATVQDPVLNGALLHRVHSESPCWYVSTDNRASGSVCAVTDIDRCGEDGIRTGTNFRTDDGAVFIHSVIVRGDVAATDIRVFANFCVASITEVREFRPATNFNILCFVERANLSAVTEHCARAKIGEGSDVGPTANKCFGRFSTANGCVLVNDDVAQRGIRTDDSCLSNLGCTMELSIRLEAHNLCQVNTDIKPSRCRIHDCHTGPHPALGDTTIELSTKRS